MGTKYFVLKSFLRQKIHNLGLLGLELKSEKFDFSKHRNKNVDHKMFHKVSSFFID